ncbi:FitA-like ribbon-helix-helix domain-containing protein [Microbacterium paraoxydans]|uniref:FitA-like ribbon-helix-helix domain-containing protein n=1 Tax=Microbacterium paraoxydans TaxID=199592 RepID=UPI0021A4F11B|nr:antitoxin [Microbacterium paraoxydans]MCT2226052.1 antitoxin [Microbacterium paraoxydans]
MARTLQVRNLPDEVHARLKERAAAERISLSDYVARELEDLVRYRSNAEVLEVSRARARAAGVSLTREGILAARDRERDGRR